MNRKGKIILIILSTITVIETVLLIFGAMEYKSLLNYSLYAGNEVYKRQVATEETGYKYEVNEDGSYKLVKAEYNK